MKNIFCVKLKFKTWVVVHRGYFRQTDFIIQKRHINSPQLLLIHSISQDQKFQQQKKIVSCVLTITPVPKFLLNHHMCNSVQLTHHT